MSRPYGKAFRAALRRYHRLVDKMLMDGLTQKERYKMERLGRKMDKADEVIYAPILARLEAEVDDVERRVMELQERIE